MIVVELILDTVDGEELNAKMRTQEESNFLLSVFQEMRNQDDLSGKT